MKSLRLKLFQKKAEHRIISRVFPVDKRDCAVDRGRKWDKVDVWVRIVRCGRGSAKSDPHLFADQCQTGINLIAGADDIVVQSGGIHLRSDDLPHIEVISCDDQWIPGELLQCERGERFTAPCGRQGDKGLRVPERERVQILLRGAAAEDDKGGVKLVIVQLLQQVGTAGLPQKDLKPGMSAFEVCHEFGDVQRAHHAQDTQPQTAAGLVGHLFHLLLQGTHVAEDALRFVDKKFTGRGGGDTFVAALKQRDAQLLFQLDNLVGEGGL